MIFSNLIVDKIKTFQAKAGSMFGQKEAEALWKETTWKLALSVSELKGLQDGWATFVIKGDRTQLDEVANSATIRLTNKA